MNRMTAIVFATSVALSACSDSAQAPEVEAERYPDEWLMFGGSVSDDFYSGIALHQTAYGLAGLLMKIDDTAVPLRNVQRTATDLSFVVPAIGAAYAGTLSDGVWTGRWTDASPHGDSLVHFEPGEYSSVMSRGPLPQLAILPDGRRMHILCEGEGVPVVLLDYGAGGTMQKDWGGIASAIAERANTRVCLYDRAGRGLSDPGPMPRDAAAVVADMEGMLTASKLPPPYVLIGHSLGSYHVRLYANTYPEKTGGMVLVDPSGDGQLERFNAAIPKLQAIQEARTTASADLDCVNRLRAAPVSRSNPIAQQCGGNDPDAIEATTSEIDQMPGASTQQLVASRRSYGDMPLIALTRMDYIKDMPPEFTADDRASMQRIWEELHAEMAALSDKSWHRFVPGAGHYIQRDKPEAVIMAASDAVAALRAASH